MTSQASTVAHRPRLSRRLVSAGAVLLLGVVLHGARVSARQAPPETVPQVDLERYAGTWFELARFPTRFQRQCVGDVTATYEGRPDGRVRVINRCRTQDGSVEEATGVARRAGSTGGKLEVRFAPRWLSFLPFVWGDYWILGLAEDYSTAVVGAPDRETLWLLSREAEVSPQVYDAMVAVAAQQGYDTARLVRTVHR